jgi:DNA polymerase I-like protein with 3'-5' exonuclease and polymerase domains
LNWDIIGTIYCDSRDKAKTLIYALLLGAQRGKVKEILGCTAHEADIVMKKLLDYYPGWRKLQESRLREEGEKGWITAIDGRLIKLPEARLALAGHLQSGEKIIMARAAKFWTKWLAPYKNIWKLQNWVHDEWQTAVKDSHGNPEKVGQYQMKSIVEAGKYYKLNIKLAGSMKVGNNWDQTH